MLMKRFERDFIFFLQRFIKHFSIVETFSYRDTFQIETPD